MSRSQCGTAPESATSTSGRAWTFGEWVRDLRPSAAVVAAREDPRDQERRGRVTGIVRVARVARTCESFVEVTVTAPFALRRHLRQLTERLMVEFWGALPPGQVLAAVYDANKLLGRWAADPERRVVACEIIARQLLVERLAEPTSPVARLA